MTIPHDANQLHSGVLVDIYEVPDTDGVWVDHKDDPEREIKQIESDNEAHDIIVDLL